MRLFKTTVMLIDPDALGQRLDVDTIEYQGKLWLVPEWIDTLDRKWTRPTRIISLDALPLERSPDGPADYLLQHPMTKAILNGQIPPELAGKVSVVQWPDIEIQVG